MVFEIQCGKYHFMRVDAPTIGAAWRDRTEHCTEGFSKLARFRTVFPKTGHWQYLTPQALDETE